MTISPRKDRFDRLAWARLEKLEKAAEVLVNCADQRNYEYSQAEANTLATRADEAARQVRDAFEGKSFLPTEEAPVAVPEGPSGQTDLGLLEQATRAIMLGDNDAALHLLAMLRANAEIAA